MIISNLPDIDQGIRKHVIQQKEEFSAFLKKVMKRKGKKIQYYYIQDYVIQTKN